MKTLFYSHEICHQHEMGPGHPESPARLEAIDRMVAKSDWQGKLHSVRAPLLPIEALYDIHPRQYVERLLALSPTRGNIPIDGDTSLNPYSLNAARYASGAACSAVTEVIGGNADNAFCAIRPPGHHAETARAMGFCLVNNVALAADRALKLGVDRVAILDFDVHHGNGTVEIFQDRPEVLVCSSFQYPFYPGRYDRVARPNIVLCPLSAGTDGDTFRRTVERPWREALDRHQPEILLISAGFDAHRLDPLAGLEWDESDFRWVTELIVSLARQHCGGRVVSVLEGGYHLEALANSVREHLLVLTGF